MSTTMNGRDAVSGSMGRCFVTIEGNRYLLMQVISVKAEMEKTKTKVPIMGRSGKGNKATGWEGSGSAKLHYNSSLFRELLLKYQNTGEDIYFDMQLVNEDPTSMVGRQTVILKGCNIDGGTLASIDADAEYLEDEFDLTFESFEIPEKFKNLPGMQ